RAGEEWRLPDSAAPDSVAGDPARHGRPTRRRHGAQAGREVSARRAEIRAARQPLTHKRAWVAVERLLLTGQVREARIILRHRACSHGPRRITAWLSSDATS